jgi:IrrE N-terminal-like domain
LRIPFDAAPDHVERMRLAWEQRGGSIEELTLNAFRALEDRTDVAVLRVPEFVPADSQLGCSVAGGYRPSPPTLVVTESMSWRRQQFTLLHELGHHLQRTDIDLGTAVVSHRDPEAFEEACCEEFAAQVLLPDDLVESRLRWEGVTARNAVELFKESNASRAAICVRLAGQLKSAGVVAVLDPDANVTFAARHGSTFPPARGSNQFANPLVRAALYEADTARVIARDNAVIWYRSGFPSDQLYGQAAWAGDRLFIVMVEYSAPWKSISLPRGKTVEKPPDLLQRCEHCGADFEVTTVCRVCHRPHCPKGHCSCSVVS